jgi:DNA-directed RNA polymerase alpha subunit
MRLLVLQKTHGARTKMEPTPELPDDIPIGEVQFPARIQNVLLAEGFSTVGQVREASDDALLSCQNFGKGSLSYVRQQLGLPSREGVRPSEKQP